MLRFSTPRSIKKLWQDERANTAMIFAIAAIPVFGIVGMGIDFARANNSKQSLQIALDNSLLAASQDGVDAYQETGADYFASNTAHITAISPAARFSHEVMDDEIVFKGRATGAVSTTISAILGINEIDLEVTSRVAVDNEADPVEGPCIYVLNETAWNAFRVNSGAKVDASGCEVHVHSRQSSAANFNSGIDLNFKRICIAGSGTTDNARNIKNVELNCTPDANPFKDKFPEPATSCNYRNLNFNGGRQKLSPGVYCGWFNFNGSNDVTFEPGVYVIKEGGWNVNGGSWKGEGVTFYFADSSKIQFNSGVSAELTPPTSGDYKNVLMFEKEGLWNSQFIFNDSRNLDVEGLIYLPSRELIYNSGSNTYSRKLTLVADRVILNSTKWKLEQGYAASPGQGSVQRTPRIIK